jgi:hypothetical protein
MKGIAAPINGLDGLQPLRVFMVVMGMGLTL